ncbi:hypothetical protein C0J52_00028 [Blattella germanica]|nr:hypothetical protein C0J52_00028 [Blattella germanica]
MGKEIEPVPGQHRRGYDHMAQDMERLIGLSRSFLNRRACFDWYIRARGASDGVYCRSAANCDDGFDYNDALLLCFLRLLRSLDDDQGVPDPPHRQPRARLRVCNNIFLTNGKRNHKMLLSTDKSILTS